MFDGFEERFMQGQGARLFLRIGGRRDAPPLLLLHGYPQTSAMWRDMAPLLAAHYRVICPDLRGYGRSDKPASDLTHQTYSKRAMAEDLVAVMEELGHQHFLIGAHDRGARVAHRLAMDHPERVGALSLLDIAPTREMYANTTAAFAKAYWHWFFLIQPHPIPETMIGRDPVSFWKLKCFNQSGGGNPFGGEALQEYLDCFSDPAAVHASCEDYRAAASIDIAHDDADGARKLAMPLQLLWAKKGTIERCFDALALWRLRAEEVEGEALEATHYMAEEIPETVAEKMREFLDSL